MAAYSDINGFPESGFPVLSDVSDRVCLNTLYWNPLKEAGFILDVVGNNRLAGNLSLAGMLSGVTSITMNGALSGVSTITASGTATLTSSNPLSLTDVNANIRMPGLNSSIGSVLERVYKGYFKNLDVANTLTVNGDDVALIGDIKRYVSGTLNTLPKYNATGITDSKFNDDGTTPKYNAKTLTRDQHDNNLLNSTNELNVANGSFAVDTYINYRGVASTGIEKYLFQRGKADNTYADIWAKEFYAIDGSKKVFHQGNLNLTTVDFTAKELRVSGGGYYSAPTLGSDFGNLKITATNGLFGTYVGVSGGGDTWFQSQRNDTNPAVYGIKLNPLGGDVSIGTLSGYLKGTAGVVGAVSSIPESDITPTAYATLTVTSNATTWDCYTGLNKKLSSSGDFTLSLTNLVNGMSGDLRLDVTSTTTITLPTSKLNGSVTSLVAAIYHLCFVYDGSNLEFNIAKYV